MDKVTCIHREAYLFVLLSFYTWTHKYHVGRIVLFLTVIPINQQAVFYLATLLYMADHSELMYAMGNWAECAYM